VREILIVEDAPDVLALLRAILSADGWLVRTAKDGEAACKLLQEHDIRLVITDWMMPGMDGLQLIDWIRDRGGKYIYTIMMTARGSEEDSIHGLECGADDYLVKPVSAGLLRARLDVARRILKMQLKLISKQEKLKQAHRQLALAYRSTQTELHSAVLQQFASLPSDVDLPPGVTTDWRFQPATNLSGDHLQFYMSGEQLVFYLLDVSGHGLTAALRSAALAELMHPSTWIMAELEHGPHRVLERLNRHICATNTEVEHLATLVLGMLDTRSGRICISSAGHPRPMVIGSHNTTRDIGDFGLPLGVMPEARYATHETRLESGQSLLLYSDGITDCANKEGEAFGYDRLAALLRELAASGPTNVASAIEERLDQWRGTVPHQDDSTLLTIGYDKGVAQTVTEELCVEMSG